MTNDDFSNLWLAYEATGDFEGCQAVINALLERDERPTEPDLPLGLSDASNLRNRRRCLTKGMVRRGCGGITPFAKRKVRSAATLLEEKHGRGRLAFLTVTVPSMPLSEMAVINQRWSYICRRLREEVQREMERHGLPVSEYLSVTEVQEKRYQRTGFVGLHIHALLLGRHSGQWWSISKERLREIWEGILSSVLGRVVEVPVGTRIEGLRTSASREMAKYLSKGCKIIQQLRADGHEEQIPRSWYQIARELGREVKAKTEQVYSGQVDVLFDNLWRLKQAGIMDYRFVLFDVPDRIEGGEVLSWRSRVCGASGFWRVKNWRQFLCDSEAELITAISKYKASRRINMSVA